MILSLVVERVSGKAFAAFLKEGIFDPLGMNDTLVKQDHARVIPRRAIGYVPRANGTFAISMSASEYTGPGKVVTTMRDLAKWDANFYAPKVGGHALVDLLRMRGKLEDGTTLHCAMGLELGERAGRPTSGTRGRSWVTGRSSPATRRIV